MLNIYKYLQLYADFFVYLNLCNLLDIIFNLGYIFTSQGYYVHFEDILDEKR